MTAEKPKAKQLLRPFTTGTNNAMNQSEFLAITRKLVKARGNSRVQGATGFGFASHRLINRREILSQSLEKCSYRYRVITFKFQQSFEKCSIARYILTKKEMLYEDFI